MGKKKRTVATLGDNALGNTLPEQVVVIRITAKAIADLIKEGYEVIVAHGNGPQVSMINDAMAALSREDANQPNAPLLTCIAMSQAYINYDLQSALREELLSRNIDNISATTMTTQVRVDEDDPASQTPSKPIGHSMTAEQAKEAEEKYDYVMKGDSGRGYCRVIASPKPAQIIEIGTIHSLVDSGQLVITYGDGGIPVTLKGNHLKGASAAIGKDFASELLAGKLDADFLIIPTAVEEAATNYGEPDVKWLSDITTDEARQYIGEGHFAPGSMLPKVQAAVEFADSKEGRTSLIILLGRAKGGIQRLTRTKIHQ